MRLRQGLLSGLFLIVSSCGPTSPEEPAPDKAPAQARAERLAVERGFDLREVSLVPESEGARHALHFRGVPIWGLEAKTSQAQTLLSNVRFEATGAVETEARLTEAQARDAALAAMRDATASVESSRLVLLPREERRLRKDAAPSFAGPRNAEDFERVVTGLRLVYRVKLSTDGEEGGFRRPWMAQVDARSGEVLHLAPLERTAATQTRRKGIGNGYYAGKVTLSVLYDSVEQASWLTDTYNNEYLGQIRLPPRGIGYEQYLSADSTFGDGLRYGGAGSLSANGETAAVDAYHAVGLAWSVYETFLGRNGPAGQAGFEIRLHLQAENAFYYPDGRSPAVGFGYRSLTANPKSPMTTTDIVAHELAHDFFARELAGDPADIPSDRSEQSGLNEGTGDIFGFATELLRDARRISPSSTNIDAVVVKASNLTVGEETGSASRDLLSPVFKEWFDGIGFEDEHYSSGPLSRMFLLLSYGCSTLSTSAWYCPRVPEGFNGVGPTEALRIWALAVQMMPVGTDYAQARQAALAAATSRDGVQGGPRMLAVARAFAAINVGYKPDSVPPQTTLSCRQVLQDIECTGTITDAEVPGQYTTAPRLVLDGGTQIKTLSGWQFTQTLPGATLASGNHTVLLQAWDYWQNLATRTVTVSLDKTPPVASFTVSGTPKQPRVSVIATDPAGIRLVEFTDGSQYLVGLFVPPYEATLDTSTWTDGTHDLVIRAYDEFMNVAVLHHALKVDNTPPTVAMTVGSGDEAPFPVNVTVTDASAVARVDFKVDGVVFATRTNAATTYQADYTPTDPLVHNLIVEVTDTFGNKGTTSRAAPLDRRPPQVTFTKTQVGSLVRLTVGVSDGCGLTYPYALYVDGNRVAEPMTPSFVLEFGDAMAAGAHTFQALVSDACGNPANFQTAFVKDLTPPVITAITRDDSQPKKPKFTVQCTDTEGVHHVELRENGLVTQLYTTAPYEFVVDTTARVDGDSTVLFQCTDVNGVSSAPETRTVTADNTPPSYNLTVYGAGRSYLVSAGTVADPRGVQSVLLSGGVIPGFSVTLTQAPYSYQWNISGTGAIQTDLPFSVTVKDSWGNSASKVLYCSVNTASTTAQYQGCHL
ncbi:Ig-like domain-containing protein [Corallococcus sp. CA053C]|uniref:Ig-like domain-containing protein n=1 Tax=Corallococcus sp. CA053C TaxID=2316732 RepID=UPI00131592E4|nr:Ig-like domain-containing protein [Corallococcus sp. CA053C]